MDYKGIQELIREMSRSGLAHLEIIGEGIQIRMSRGGIAPGGASTETQEALAPALGLPQEIQEAHPQVPVDGPRMDAPEEKNLVVVTSPIVGTFYRAPAPDAPPFVQVGDRVEKGQSLCIIEAMKLMNEIESEVAGEVVAILVENEEMVEYGQPLIQIRI